MAGDHVWTKGRRFLLEDDGDDVVANVPFSLQLLRVSGAVRKERGYVKENLSTSEYLVHRGIASLPMPRI